MCEFYVQQAFPVPVGGNDVLKKLLHKLTVNHQMSHCKRKHGLFHYFSLYPIQLGNFRVSENVFCLKNQLMTSYNVKIMP